jgi:hypothetical protein
LRITTSDASGFYLDAEDSATNNRFSIKRDPSSQEVTLDFASNPAGSTTLVGAIRTYQDGDNLSNAMSFIEDGSIGVGTNTPIGILHLKRTAATTRMVMDGDAGQSKIITYRTAGLQRFGLYVNNTAESGSNAGSDFAIRAYSDAGTLLNTPLFIKRSTGNVGIGTTTPAGKFDIVSDGGGQFIFSRYGDQPEMNIRRSGGTFAAPTAVVGGASSVLNFQNYDGTSFGTSAQIQSVPVENQTTTAKGASLALNVVQEGTTTAINGLVVSGVSTTAGSVSITTNFSSAQARLSIWGTALTPTLPYFNIQETGGGELLEFSNAGNLLVGSGTPSNTAKVSVKGSGSTQATTSLLLQNSVGTELFKIRDDGNIIIQSTRTSFGYSNGSRSIVFDETETGVYGSGVGIQGFGGFGVKTFDGSAYTLGFVLTGNGNQRVGIGTGSTSPNASAKLELASTTQGFLPPRMTNVQRAAITSPAVGLMVYCTDAVEGLYVYKSTGWTFVI